MAIWLGSGGGLRIERMASSRMFAYVGPADVDVGSNRISVDRVTQSLITGDLVAIKRVDENGQSVPELLDFVSASGWSDGQQHSDGQWYVNVDAVGGVRLYSKWRESLEGTIADAIQLSRPSERYRISLQTVSAGGARCMAQTTSWVLNTNRDVADITSRGEGFQKQMATLVSGSGELECFFDAIPDACGEDSNYERSVYFHQLALRQEIGSTFIGVFLLKRSGTLPITVMEQYRERELFYKCECVITEVASEVNTENILESKVQFVTTGAIQLLYSFPVDYLLQEQPPNDKVLQESDFGIVLETPA
jgi:hypothetical protein